MRHRRGRNVYRWWHDVRLSNGVYELWVNFISSSGSSGLVAQEYGTCLSSNSSLSSLPSSSSEGFSRAFSTTARSLRFDVFNPPMRRPPISSHGPIRDKSKAAALVNHFFWARSQLRCFSNSGLSDEFNDTLRPQSAEPWWFCEQCLSRNTREQMACEGCGAKRFPDVPQRDERRASSRAYHNDVTHRTGDRHKPVLMASSAPRIVRNSTDDLTSVVNEAPHTSVERDNGGGPRQVASVRVDANEASSNTHRSSSWSCSACKFSNFASRQYCFKCGLNRSKTGKNLFDESSRSRACVPQGGESTSTPESAKPQSISRGRRTFEEERQRARDFLLRNVTPLSHLVGVHSASNITPSSTSSCSYVIPHVSSGFFGRDSRIRKLIIRLSEKIPEKDVSPRGTRGIKNTSESPSRTQETQKTSQRVNKYDRVQEESDSAESTSSPNLFSLCSAGGVRLLEDPKHALPAFSGWEGGGADAQVDVPAVAATLGVAGLDVRLPPSHLRNNRMQNGDWGCGACHSFNKAAWPICGVCGNNRYKFPLLRETHSRGGEREDSPKKGEKSMRYAVPNITYMGVVGLDDQIRLSRLQETVFAAYADACSGPLERWIESGRKLVRPLGSQTDTASAIGEQRERSSKDHLVGAGMGSVGEDDGSNTLTGVVEPPIFKTLFSSRSELIDVLFTEPAWFCHHCGFISKPSPRLGVVLMEALFEGRLSIYDAYVVSLALKHRPTCDHCLTHRMPSCAPYVHPAFKNDMPLAGSLYPKHIGIGTSTEVLECDRFIRYASRQWLLHSSLSGAASPSLLLPPSLRPLGYLGPSSSSSVEYHGDEEGAADREGKNKSPPANKFDHSTGRFLNKGLRPVGASGDWICKCGALNYRLRRVCSGCALGRLRGLASLRLNTGSENYGDWLCSCCLVWNLRQSEDCFNCHWRSGSGNSVTVAASGYKNVAVTESGLPSEPQRPRWSGADAVALGVRRDLPASLEEAEERNSKALAELLECEDSNRDGIEGCEESRRQPPFNASKGKERINHALVTARTATKFTNGHISNALFIVGEDLLPAAAVEPELQKVLTNCTRAKEHTSEENRSQKSSPHSGDVGSLWASDRSPEAVAREFSNRRQVSKGNDVRMSYSASTEIALAKAIRSTYPTALSKLGVCASCGYRNRYDEMGPGSTCKRCFSVVFPMLFPRWERIERDDQKFVFTQSSESDLIPTKVHVGVPALSARVADMCSRAGSLIITQPCPACGVYNSEHRTRCRRCGHTSRWQCDAEVPEEDEDGIPRVDKAGNVIMVRCGEVNSKERSYCGKCGTIRRTGSVSKTAVRKEFSTSRGTSDRRVPKEIQKARATKKGSKK